MPALFPKEFREDVIRVAKNREPGALENAVAIRGDVAGCVAHSDRSNLVSSAAGCSAAP
jgi:hypothetical protein